MIMRDVGGILVGLGGILYTVIKVEPNDVNVSFMIVLALVAGMPGAAQLIAVIRGGSLIDTQSLSLQEQPSSSQSQSLPPTASNERQG
jgi:hypothetical protein